MKAIRADADIETQLVADMADFYYNPLGWAEYAFEWGKGDLVGRKLRRWQKKALWDLGEELKKRDFNGIDPVEPCQFSTASGHGIGKSALVAMVILFIMSTRPNAKGIISANTLAQLQTKTWAELGKWHKRCIVGHWFEWRGSKGGLAFWAKTAPDSWRVDGQTCREENSEAFAGLHSADSTPFYIFDEASAIPEKIFEVAQGGLTDGEPIIMLFGNPTRNSGFFRYTHGKFKHRWSTRQIDSREVEGTNKELFKRWIEDYGEDSDYVRVRVKGMFPRASSMQFIDSDSVYKAMHRDAGFDFNDPLVVGIDIARGGDDKVVMYPRRGMDAKSIPPVKIPGELVRDSMRLISIITTKLDEWKPDAVFVDATGIGGPVADRLRQLGYVVYDVNFGGESPVKRCKNMAAYMWECMKEAIRAGLALPEDTELEEELTQREYWHNEKDQVVMESKDDLKERGLASPDTADGLALTYAMAIQRQENVVMKSLPGIRRKTNAPMHESHDVDPLRDEG
jgi:hypothetical protein